MSARLNKMMAFYVLGLLMLAGPIYAQQSGPGGVPSQTLQPMKTAPTKTAGAPHKFLDGENLALFAGVAAVRALDYTSTRHFRERGLNEVLLTNGIVDNKPLFATIEVAGTAASIGVSYLLHRTGHHRAERWVSIVHIGVATFGDIRNYGLSNPTYNAAGP